jgi:hypothetical protein
VSLLQQYILPLLPTIQSITFESSNNYLDIVFSSDLELSEKTILDNLINDYTNPLNPIIYKPVIINSVLLQSNNSVWTRLCEWVDNGIRVLDNITINSRLQPNNDIENPDFKYFIRLVDITHNVVLGVSEYTNIENIINTISITDFALNSNSLIELQVKKNAPGITIDILAVIANYL